MTWRAAHPLVHDETRWADPALEFGRWLQVDRRPERCRYDDEPGLRRGELELWVMVHSELTNKLSGGELLAHELAARGLSAREIAQGLDVSVRAVRTWQRRAERKLRMAS